MRIVVRKVPRASRRSRGSANREFRARGLSALRAREYEAVPLERRLPPRKGTRKEGSEGGKKALACANRGASFRAARCAPRLHLPEIHHLRVPPPPFTFSCFLPPLFPSVTPLSLSRATQPPTTSSLSWPAITQVPLAKAAKRLLLREASRHRESVLVVSRRTVCPWVFEKERAAVGLPGSPLQADPIPECRLTWGVKVNIGLHESFQRSQPVIR